MKLPILEHLEIPQRKIVNYLLDLTHPDGRGKAIFFIRFGFTLENWEQLTDALRTHAYEHEVAQVEQSTFGVRYVVEGILNTPDGRNPMVRSVWFVETDQDITRFVTAYALEVNQDDS
jgi:hypothetical protein